MNRVSQGILGGLVVVSLFAIMSSLFIVHQAETALVLRLGRVRDVIVEPGLHFKVPLIENVVRYDARILDLDPPAEQIILADQKRIDVDTYTRFRIANPLQFFQAVRSEEAARARLREIVNNSVRRVLGNVMLPGVLSPEREQIMRHMRDQVNAAAQNLGIEVVDVRIRRADLPPEASQAIYRRMESERQREAAEARAQGFERAQQIKAGADRERTVLLAEAQRQSQILRGQGDNEANKTYAQAFTQDPAFFNFYRSLEAYRQSLGSSETTYVLSPDSDFLKYFSTAPGHR